MNIKRSGRCLKALGGSLAVCLALASCGTPKKVAYFQDVETAVVKEMTERQAIKVKPGDKLSIVVKSKDPTLSELFNMPAHTAAPEPPSGRIQAAATECRATRWLLTATLISRCSENCI